jgi:hypothetical protein
MYKQRTLVNLLNLEAFLIPGKGELLIAFANRTPVKPRKFILFMRPSSLKAKVAPNGWRQSDASKPSKFICKAFPY